MIDVRKVLWVLTESPLGCYILCCDDIKEN